MSDTDTTSPLQELLEALESILEVVNPITPQKLTTYLAELSGLAAIVLGWVNPNATLTTTEQVVVSLAGVGALVIMGTVRLFLHTKKVSLAMGMVMSHLDLQAGITSDEGEAQFNLLALQARRAQNSELQTAHSVTSTVEPNSQLI